MDINGLDEAGNHRTRFLMRMMTNLNAGARLVLCLWLAIAATDSQSNQEAAGTSLRIHGCSCVLHEVTDWAGRTNLAFRN
ncbi:MAG: hypothetical protein RJA24_123 [Pseudomonadota bacterium]|jgi:hypothetical protein